LLVAACSQAPEQAQYTVEEYRANDTLREAKVKECTSDPGTLAGTPDCVNALRAASLESRGSLRESSPIGLDPVRDPLGNGSSPQDHERDRNAPQPSSQPRSTP
jgi:hypothetical protein